MRWQEFWLYAGVVVASIAVMVRCLGLWRANLHVLINYWAGGDLFLFGALIKGVLENGWFLYNPSLGAPGGLQMQDFPLLENVSFAVMKGIGFFTHNWAVVQNLYFLAGFPLAALAAVFVLRRLGVSRLASAAAALLFAFMPFHFMRGGAHLALGSYFPVPLILLVAFWLFADRVPFFGDVTGEARARLSVKDARTWGAIAICILAGSYGVYYAYFACFFIVMASVFAVIRTGQWSRVISGVLLVVVIVGAVLVAAAPTLAYRQHYGENPVSVQRSAIESELYGLNVVQMLLPMSGHRVPALAALKHRYDVQATKVGRLNENATSTLGLVASAGFLLLLLVTPFGVAFTSREDRRGREVLVPASQLSIMGLLLATSGGLGTLLAFTVLPQIRGYTRVSIYLAFLALAAVALLLDVVRERFAAKSWGPILTSGLVVLVLVVGLYDQIVPGFTPHYRKSQASWDSDAAFVARIESATPKQTLVFQVPYAAFPEPSLGPTDAGYDHLRGYLHSTDLKWSHGAMKGRPADLRVETLAHSPNLVADLRAAGYSGLWVDRRAYAASAPSIDETALAQVLGAPIVSPDERFFFFSLK